MIPLKLRLKGFLSYHDEQEIDFSPASLWMMTGANGAGKSSLFDAMTFALYGEHRGGNQGREELVNIRSTKGVVEFEFRLGLDAFRIRRTLSRTKDNKVSGTQQAERRVEGLAGETWEPVPNTSSATGFKEWVAREVGITHATFVSSILLEQGRAERLLNAKPAERHAHLAEIVNLQRYQGLHKRAVEAAKDARDELLKLEARQSAVAPVTWQDVEAADLAANDAETHVEELKATLPALEADYDRAREFERLKAEGRGLRADRAGLDALLSRREAVERDFAELTRLRAAKPPLADLLRLARNRVEAESEAAGSERDATARDTERAGHLQAAELARTQIDASENERRLAADQLRQATSLLVEHAALAQHAKRYVEIRTKLSAAKAASSAIPADLSVRVAEAEAIVERLERLAASLPALVAYSQARDRLRERRAALAASGEAVERVTGEGKRAKAELAARADEFERAKAEHDSASVGFLAERQRLLALQGDLDNFRLNEDAKVCRACGHPLTPKHFREELARRRDEITRLTDAVSEAEKDAGRLERRRKQAEAARQTAQGEYDKLREAYQTARVQKEAASAEVEGGEKALLGAADELSEDDRRLIGADLEHSRYPSQTVLADLKVQSNQVPAARQKLRTLEAQTREAEAAKSRVEELSAEASAQEQLLGGRSPEEVAAEQSRLTREAASLRDREAGSDRLIAEARKRADAASAKGEAAGRAADEARRKSDAARQRLALLAEQSREASGKLPPGVLAADAPEAAVRSALSAVEAGVTQFERAGVERHFRELEPARLRADELDRRIGESDAALAGFDPPPPASASAAAELATRRGRVAEAEKSSTLLTSQAAEARRRWEQLRELAEESANARAASSAAAKLADLLGRDYLQRHLMRTAERSIVERANAILDRLSSGALALQLRPQAEASAETALDLEVLNRELHGTQMLGLAFLSGSQKFRVAVALALAIGQYASRQTRPVETVMIDEGFGCLDQQGRTEVIQEFQNLRDLMKCVILVSHQEEIAQVFPNRYEFRLEDGTTRVTRAS